MNKTTRITLTILCILAMFGIANCASKFLANTENELNDQSTKYQQMGYNAAKQGQDAKQCPYQNNGYKRENWMLGWQKGKDKK